MSSKSTLILSEDNEHWYEETNSSRCTRHGKFVGFDIVIEIDKKNIVDRDESSNDIVFTIKGDSDLAKRLSKLMFKQARIVI